MSVVAGREIISAFESVSSVRFQITTLGCLLYKEFYFYFFVNRWGLANQTPPYYIEYQTTKYDKQIHERFHTSDNESEAIIEYVWPCLIDGRDRACVAKGVVITDERYLSISKNTPS
jgi:hypothetical protein